MTVSINGSSSVTINSGAVLGITSGTAVASTSGTSIDFTSIPSWVKRITVMFNGVSTNGSSNLQVQIGAGSVTTSGYVGNCSNQSGGTGAAFSAGFVFQLSNSAAQAVTGIMCVALLGSNTWVETSSVSDSGASGALRYGAGSLALGGTLDRVRITTANGTDTFDAGSINILYE
jgi:hypothetical protein